MWCKKFDGLGKHQDGRGAGGRNNVLGVKSFCLLSPTYGKPNVLP